MLADGGAVERGDERGSGKFAVLGCCTRNGRDAFEPETDCRVGLPILRRREMRAGAGCRLI